MPGKFIVIEGLEGAGKTTAIQTVTRILNQHKITQIVYTREPGGTPIAERLRTIIKEGVSGDPLTAKAELLMFYAARSQVIENKIKPALSANKWVVGDRHDLSTQAYQGGGRQLDGAFMSMLKQGVLNGFKPDLTIYMDIPPELGLKRAQARGELDRIEQESLAFFTRTRQRYLQLASQDNSIVTIDASQTLPQVTDAVELALTTWLMHHGIN